MSVGADGFSVLDVAALELTDRWPADLAPEGEDFEEWWERHQGRLGHLHRRLVEQWVHRHWDASPFTFIPLDTLEWRLETWSTDEVLGGVGLLQLDPLDAKQDGECFANDGRSNATVAGFKNGTWDYPIVILETPAGVRCAEGLRPEVRFLLIEGRQRLRYLNVRAAQELRTGPHEVFVLRSPLTAP